MLTFRALLAATALAGLPGLVFAQAVPVDPDLPRYAATAGLSGSAFEFA